MHRGRGRRAWREWRCELGGAQLLGTRAQRGDDRRGFASRTLEAEAVELGGDDLADTRELGAPLLQ